MLRYYYYYHSINKSNRIQYLLANIIELKGKDFKISNNMTAYSLCVRMYNSYNDGIKSIKDWSEMKEQYLMLKDLLNEIRTIHKNLIEKESI